MGFKGRTQGGSCSSINRVKDEDIFDITLMDDDLCGDQEITFQMLDVYADDLPLTYLYCFVKKYSNLLV